MSAESSPRHTGRSLLWAMSNNTDDIIPSVEGGLPGNSTSVPMCPMYFNQSESIRLDNQLRGWFRVDPVNDKGKDHYQTSRDYQRYERGRTIPSTTTSLSHYERSKRPPKARGLTGGIYHMLIADADNVNSQKRR